jgi:hypothetical protein
VSRQPCNLLPFRVEHLSPDEILYITEEGALAILKNRSAIAREGKAIL